MYLHLIIHTYLSIFDSLICILCACYIANLLAPTAVSPCCVLCVAIGVAIGESAQVHYLHVYLRCILLLTCGP